MHFWLQPLYSHPSPVGHSDDKSGIFGSECKTHTDGHPDAHGHCIAKRPQGRIPSHRSGRPPRICHRWAGRGRRRRRHVRPKPPPATPVAAATAHLCNRVAASGQLQLGDSPAPTRRLQHQLNGRATSRRHCGEASGRGRRRRATAGRCPPLPRKGQRPRVGARQRTAIARWRSSATTHAHG